MCDYKERCWRYWYSVEMKRNPYSIPPTRDELFFLHDIPVNTMQLKKSLYCEVMPSIGHEVNVCPWMADGKKEMCHEYQKEEKKKQREMQKKFPGQEKRLTISQDIRKLVAEKYNHRCVYCGKYHNQIVDGEKTQTVVDHFTPLALGGHPTDLDNLVLSCRKCNREKSTNIWPLGYRMKA